MIADEFIEELECATNLPVLVGTVGSKALPFNVSYVCFVNGRITDDGCMTNPCGDFENVEETLKNATLEAIRRAAPKDTVALVVRRGAICQFLIKSPDWDMENMLYQPKRVQFRTRVAFLTTQTLKGVDHD